MSDSDTFAVLDKSNKTKNNSGFSFSYDPAIDKYAVMNKEKKSKLVLQSVDDQNTYDADNIYSKNIPRVITEDAAAYDSATCLTYSQLDRKQLPQSIPSQKTVALEQTNSMSCYGFACSEKCDNRNLSKKEKPCASSVCLLACYIFLIIVIVAAIAALIVVFVLIANLQFDLASMTMESVNNSRSNCPFMNSLNSLKTNFTELERKLQLFFNKVEQRIIKLDDQADNLTDVQGKAIQTEVAMRISELESKLSMCSVEYSTNWTYFLNSLKDNASNNISNAREAVQQSVDELTTRIAHDIQNLHEFESCAAINNLSLPFSSGEYMTKTPTESIRMYCIFSCNGIAGGWKRIAYLNTSDSSADQCPGDDLEQIGTLGQGNNPLSCRRNVLESGCSSVIYSNHGNSYSRVCGMINAYQVGSPDGFRDKLDDSIEGTYVDGVSLTHGMNTRNHIWTFVAQVTDTCTDCGTSQPNFIGSHFSCESNLRCNNNVVCPIDVLWNGDQCVGEAWFYRSLDQSTTDDIEMRVCRSQNRPDEDLRVSFVEIYVQ